MLLFKVQEYLDVLKTLPPQVLVACGRQIIYSQPEVHQPAQDDDQVLKIASLFLLIDTSLKLISIVLLLLCRRY